MKAESSPCRVGTAHQPGRHKTPARALSFRRLAALPAATAIFTIRFYQHYLRPHLFGNCKFDPTCSHYGVGCLEKHGLLRGGWLTLRRVVRCHPFAKGGHDPVP